MIRLPFILFKNYRTFLSQSTNSIRYARNPRRGNGPKFIESKVKTVTVHDDFSQIESYKDFVDTVKKSKLGDELEIEKEFLNADYHGDAIERCEELYDSHLREEKTYRSKVKKIIIGKKYFKLDKETNLLTYAAKEQIRFLHKSNPEEWNYKTLSECFPISEEGVKKLLKHDFVLTCPEKIKIHDEKVAEKWKILKSGQATDLITPLTQKLYREGKLVDDYFCGNPNLPTVSPTKKIIQVEEKKEVGEFSAIVQTYVDYKKQKLISCKEYSENQASITDNNGSEFKRSDKSIRKFRYAPEEFDDEHSEIVPTCSKQKANDTDIPLSQFKELLKDEINLKSRHNSNLLWQQTSDQEDKLPEQPYNIQTFFTKIPKYDKENISFIYERNKKARNVYKYDEKLGYQHLFQTNIKSKIYLNSKLYKKGKLHKVGHCVYDDDGQFLYKVF